MMYQSRNINFSVSRKSTLVLTIILILVLTPVGGTAEGNKNNKIKQMIESTGCPFVSRKQLLVRNVCILPDYQQTELPEFAAHGGITKVDIYLHEAKVLEIDERKDKITIKISQLMEWGDFRVKANFPKSRNPQSTLNFRQEIYSHFGIQIWICLPKI